MLVYAALAGGLPFLIFAGAVLLWARGKNDVALCKLSLADPLIFTLLVVPVFLVPDLLKTDSLLDLSQLPGFSAGLYVGLSYVGLFTVYPLAIGYFYVLLTHALYGSLRLVAKVGPLRRQGQADVRLPRHDDTAPKCKVPFARAPQAKNL